MWSGDDVKIVIVIFMPQVVVEKKIMRERKLTRHDLGREKFVSEVCFGNNFFK